MSTTEGRAGYYRLVASGHGAALAAASQHALASIDAADPEAVASHGETISKACSQLIRIADLLTIPLPVPEVAQRPSLRSSRTRKELRDEAVRILNGHLAATGKRMSGKNLARALTLQYAVALEIRAEVRDRTGEDLPAGQPAPPAGTAEFAKRDAQGRAAGARRAREAEVTTSGEGR